MTAPTQAALSVTLAGNTLTGFTCTFAVNGPSGIVDGSLLVAEVHASNNGGGGNTINTPAGWTLDPDAKSSSATTELRVFTRVMDGTELSVTFSCSAGDASNGMTARIARISGHHDSTPINDVVSTATAVGATTYTINGANTTFPDCLVYYFVGGFGASGRTFAPSAGLTERWDFSGDPGDASTLAAATLVQAAKGATGNRTYNPNTNTDCAGICMAIAPVVTHVSISDDATLAEGFDIENTIPLTDDFTLAESPVDILAEVPLFDGFSTLDTSDILAVVPTTDDVLSTDDITISAFLSSIDTVTLTETETLETQTDLSDSATLSEVLSLLSQLSLSEPVVVIDEETVITYGARKIFVVVDEF